MKPIFNLEIEIVNLKRNLVALVIFCVTSLGGVEALAAQNGKLPKNTKLSGVFTKKIIKTKDLKGDGKVLVFFASWCQGCSKVIKKIQKGIAKETLNKSAYIVSVDEDKSAAKSYFSGKGSLKRFWRHKAYLDKEGLLAEKLGVESLPAVVLLDKTGSVLKVWDKGFRNKEVGELKQMMKKMEAK